MNLMATALPMQQLALFFLAAAAIEAVAALAAALGLGGLPAGVALTAADYPQLAADALADEVLANTPRQPAAADVTSLLADACQPRK